MRLHIRERTASDTCLSQMLMRLEPAPETSCKVLQAAAPLGRDVTVQSDHCIQVKANRCFNSRAWRQPLIDRRLEAETVPAGITYGRHAAR